MKNNAYIKEIFSSIQGEGKYVGVRQIFIRFAGCNVNCKNCDTDYIAKSYFYCNNKRYKNPLPPSELEKIIDDNFKLNMYHSIALTGGEPLIHKNFLKDFLPLIKNKGVKIFLETSGILVDEIFEVEQYIDIISVDLKIYESFGVECDLKEIGKLVSLLDKVYFKIVISENIDFEKMEKIIKYIKEMGVKELYLHFINNKFNLRILDKILDLCYCYNIMGYFIPQIHKLVGIK